MGLENECLESDDFKTVVDDLYIALKLVEMDEQGVWLKVSWG